ncbi:hypothetical protein F511_33710 [Dorcoceras hygrometricum]|uniref:Uncharacterized protein n=1 Tax=Dorcoceras hygrometricum TaxID=472368 RepID=A0A2Z7CHG1_9LAMI|nr:hypothetical protein F511_33710 [Dorcoceras hygrometricum]
MMFRVVRTNQYNQDLGLIHSTNGNHLESPKEGSSIDHQVTIYLHAQNIKMSPTNETCRHSAAANSPTGGHHQRNAQRKAARSSRSTARITAHVTPNDGATRGLSSGHHCAPSARSGAHQPATSSATICAGQGRQSADLRGRSASYARAGGGASMRGGAAAGDDRLRLIKYTTGSKVPSSACTKRPDEISMDENSSSRWLEQVRRGKAAAAAAASGKHGSGVRLGEEGGGREVIFGD